jgi:HD-GYP domain-containing protein (c-di-GMP phosphodiesterase class II)
MPQYPDIVAIVDAIMVRRDAYNHHGKRVQVLVMDFAQRLGLTLHETEMVGVGGALHDIGKISVSSSILNAPRNLAPHEYAQVRIHAREGWRMIHPLGYDPIIPDMILHHHENWDGSGYPDGIGGEQIELSARIMRIVDVYDALTNKRPHRDALAHEFAERQMLELSGKWFDPTLLQFFFEKVLNASGKNTA